MSYVEYYDGLVDQLKDNLTAEFNGYIEKLKTGLQLSERIKALLPKKVTIFLKGKLK